MKRRRAGAPRLGWWHSVVLAALLTPTAGYAQELVSVPELRERVTDLTGTLDASQRVSLESKLQALEDETGAQVAVLLVPTARPEAIEQLALRVAEAWQLGREGVDDGALLLVALEDREVRIEVGYGLEGALTDATSRRIIDEAIVPHFRNGDMYGGLAAGVDRIIGVVRGEELPPPADRPETGVSDWGRLLPFLFIAALVGGAILRAIFGRLLGSAATGGLTGFLVFALTALWGAALGAGFFVFLATLTMGGSRGWTTRGRRGGGGFFGGWGGFGGTGGGWGGGLGGGGGWSGGGGGFGGGGASGRW